VLIDYYLPETVKDGLKMEIVDSQNKPVVTILGDSTQLNSSVEQVEDMNLSRTFTYVDEKLVNKPGLHRFAWNLQQKGPWNKDPKRSYKNGPMVAPGTYTARLTIGAKTLEQPFEVIMDPRVAEEGISEADIEKQLAMQMKVIDLLNEAGKLKEDLEAKAESLSGKRGTKDELEEVNSILNQLKNDEGAYPQEMLLSQIYYLYNMLNGADQLPGRDALVRYDELVAELEALKEQAAKVI
jgi:hypothetical protein